MAKPIAEAKKILFIAENGFKWGEQGPETFDFYNRQLAKCRLLPGELAVFQKRLKEIFKIEKK